MTHISVLLEEAISFLNIKPNQNFVDVTAGTGGHTLEILKRNGPAGKVLCLDWDDEALIKVRQKIAAANSEFLKRTIFCEGNFADLEKIISQNNFRDISGVLADLGLSSLQLEESGRGFSFLKNEALDMRFSKKQNLTAQEILNQWSQKDLEKILKDYGQERFARRLSEEIVKRRKIKPIFKTQELVSLIAETIPKKFQHVRIHFSTRTFQALRIAVNNELGNLKRFLPQAINVLKNDGRLVVISFHSLEDKIVKNFFREGKTQGILEILTKKPLPPSLVEIKFNPRSHSAKLRAALKRALL